MTSANVTYYTIRDLQENDVGRHSQHCLCKTHWEKLLVFTPPENFTIQPWGYDDEEEYWEGRTHNLRDFIGYLRVTSGLK